MISDTMISPKNARNLVAIGACFLLTAQMAAATCCNQEEPDSDSHGKNDDDVSLGGNGFKYDLPSQILPKLFIGMKENVYWSEIAEGYTNTEEVKRNGWNPQDPLADLRNLGITHIVTCCYFGGSIYPEDLKERINHHGMQIHIGKMKDEPRSDSTDLQTALTEAKEFMRQGISGNNKLLIHCKAGQNRSVSLATAFIMTNYFNYNMTLKDAWDYVFPARIKARVHPEYKEQLERLEMSVRGKKSNHKIRTTHTRQFNQIARQMFGGEFNDDDIFRRNDSFRIASYSRPPSGESMSERLPSESFNWKKKEGW